VPAVGPRSQRTLTWWGVSVAIVNHSSSAAGAIISSSTMTKAVPVFVAVMVWFDPRAD